METGSSDGQIMMGEEISDEPVHLKVEESQDVLPKTETNDCDSDKDVVNDNNFKTTMSTAANEENQVENVADKHYLYTRSPSSDSNSDDESYDERPTEGVPECLNEEYFVGTWNDDNHDKNHMTEQSKDADNHKEQLPEKVLSHHQQVESCDESFGQQQLNDDEESIRTDGDQNLLGGNCQHQQSPVVSERVVKIFVSNLPPGMETLELMELFGRYGEIVNCEIFAKNYAFVNMLKESALHAIEELNGLDIRGCRINVKKSVQTGGPMQATKREFTNELEATTFKVYIGGFEEGVQKDFVQKLMEEYGRVVEVEIFRQTAAFVHMETEEGGRKVIENLHGKKLPSFIHSDHSSPLRVTESTNPQPPSLPTVRLKIKNVSTTTTASEIRELFTPYGMVLKVQVFPKFVKEGCNRDAFVFLEQYGNIRSAIKDLNGKEVNGNRLHVEACFANNNNTERKPIQKQPRGNARANYTNQGFDGWQSDNSSYHSSVVSSFQPLTSYPNSRKRLIPMPSVHEISRFPGRGKPRCNNFIHLQRQNSFIPEGSYVNDLDYSYDNQGTIEEEEYGEDYSTYEMEDYNESSFDAGSAGNNFMLPQIRNNQGMFGERQNGNNPFDAQSSNAADGTMATSFFPSFPTPENFSMGRPTPLMSVNVQNPNLSTENCDWSADLPLSNLGDFASASSSAHNFETSDPAIASSTHAVPFDYSQMGRRKPYKNAVVRRNNNIPSQRFQQGKQSGKSRGGKKGKSKRPGLGSSQQQKKFAVQSGNAEAEAPALSTTIQLGTMHQQSDVGESPTASSSHNANAAPPPSYFKQTWNFNNKSKQQRRNGGGRPTAKQLKESEEEQKRQYADYLRNKPWLYQAIPGTVKRVEK